MASLFGARHVSALHAYSVACICNTCVIDGHDYFDAVLMLAIAPT